MPLTEKEIADLKEKARQVHLTVKTLVWSGGPSGAPSAQTDIPDPLLAFLED